jgi:hypothetical protein
MVRSLKEKKWINGEGHLLLFFHRFLFLFFFFFFCFVTNHSVAYDVQSNCSLKREDEGRVIKVAYRSLLSLCFRRALEYENKRAAHFYLQLSSELNSLKFKRKKKSSIHAHTVLFFLSGQRK